MHCCTGPDLLKAVSCLILSSSTNFLHVCWWFPNSKARLWLKPQRLRQLRALRVHAVYDCKAGQEPAVRTVDCGTSHSLCANKVTEIHSLQLLVINAMPTYKAC